MVENSPLGVSDNYSKISSYGSNPIDFSTTGVSLMEEPIISLNHSESIDNCLNNTLDLRYDDSVLLVEDDPSVYESLIEFLKDIMHLEVTHVTSRQGLENYLDNAKTLPGAVILDGFYVNGTYQTAIDYLNGFGYDIAHKVIMQTGTKNRIDPYFLANPPVKEINEKPVRLMEIGTKVQEILDKAA